MLRHTAISPFFLGAILSLATALTSPANASEHLTVYVGTYTGDESKGIYAFDFDSNTGKPGLARLVAETPSPSFVALHPNGNYLYAVNETDQFNGQDGGGISAFAIQSGSSLTALNQFPTNGNHPCHLFLDKEGRNVLIVNYSGGSVISYQLKSDGRLGSMGSFIQHTGSSVNQQRQTSPHAHGIYLDRNNQLALVPDLGLDQVLIYAFDSKSGNLNPAKNPFATVKPGSGPRHLAIHPTGNLVFVLNEMASTITSFQFNPTTAAMSELSTVSTLPKSYAGGSSTAEIFVHPNGRFVYSSNRGHDSIAMFSIDEGNGKLTLIGHQSTGGKTPRNFNISPDGDWLLAANQNSGTVSVFGIDQTSGNLVSTGSQIRVPSPVCLVFGEAK